MLQSYRTPTVPEWFSILQFLDFSAYSFRSFQPTLSDFNTPAAVFSTLTSPLGPNAPQVHLWPLQTC